MKKLLIVILSSFAVMSLSAQNVQTSDTVVTKKAPSWRIALHGGYAFQTGKVDKNQEQVVVDHAKKLRHCVSYGADVTWYLVKSFGVGLKYSNIHTANSENVTLKYTDGTHRSGLMEDKIDISFVGPMASYRLLSRNMRSAFIVNFGLGYMRYRNNFVLIDPYVMKGGTMGYVWDVGYDFGITDKIAIGAMLSLASGVLTNYKTNLNGAMENVSLEENSYIGLGHLSASIGLRFNL